jgi:indole-3-glycerol phosphate synthase
VSGTGILERITRRKLKRVEEAMRDVPWARMEEMALAAPVPRRFLGSLEASPMAIIAEVKRASPSRGVLMLDPDPLGMALAYERAGVNAVSVVTEEDFFLGTQSDLRTVRGGISLPVMRKDFIIHPYQVLESRAIGADAVLLIVKCLWEKGLKEFLGLCESIGLEALVEVHDREEAHIAVSAGARIIGINNRDLVTFHTDTGVTEAVSPVIPPDRFVVSESGIWGREDVARVCRAGARGVLVGEALVKCGPGGVQAKIREFRAKEDGF